MSVLLEVAAFFLHEMTERDIGVGVNDDGSFALTRHGLDYRINLDQLSKEYAQDRDAQRIYDFIEQLMTSLETTPTWDDVEPRLYYMAESTQCDFGDAIHQCIAGELCCVPVHLLPKERGVIWLTPALLESWEKTIDDIQMSAARNLAGLVDKTKFHVQEYDGFQLGMFITPSLMKASLLFAPNLRDTVEPKLGWPILTILPCPDFAYLLPESAAEFLPRLHSVIVSEFFQHNHTISVEIYRVDEQDIQVVDRFSLDQLQY